MLIYGPIMNCFMYLLRVVHSTYTCLYVPWGNCVLRFLLHFLHMQEASSAPIPEPPPLLELLQRQQSDTLFCPSLADRVMIDVASATVTVIEMCCMRELRVATSSNASLLERVTVIRTLLSAGQLRLPRYMYYYGMCTHNELQLTDKCLFPHSPSPSVSLHIVHVHIQTCTYISLYPCRWVSTCINIPCCLWLHYIIFCPSCMHFQLFTKPGRGCPAPRCEEDSL